MISWLLLQSGPCSAAFNMALDEALLEAMPRLGAPVLRFYGWTEPAASFGYFQKYAEVERATMLRPLMRRPTGGGIVPHDADWTYSVAFPAGHEWYRLPAVESYCRVHEWIQAAFASLNFTTDLAASCHPPRSSRRKEAHASKSEINQSLLTSAATKELPGECFVGHEKSDVLWRGKKIAGAAQRRTKTGLLIQGSIQPPPLSLARAVWERAMTGVAGQTWRSFDPDSSLRSRVAGLVAEKYALPGYLRKR